MTPYDVGNTLHFLILITDDTKPLREPILTYYQRDPLSFIPG